MSNPIKNLKCILDKRDALYAKFAEQHMNLHDDRHLTAGKIYQNTKELEAAAREVVVTLDHVRGGLI